MKPIQFEEMNTEFAKDQEQYNTLPALRYGDRNGGVVCCWTLNFKERIKLLFTGRLWTHVLTFQEPLQPMFISTNKDDVIDKEITLAIREQKKLEEEKIKLQHKD